MSHRGTNWAIQQRGLKPATKLVLWHLADRHNPDYGCFPSQEQLAHDAEMSRSTLNEHLDLLEAAGLLRRERRHDPQTHRRLRTRYILAFEEDFAAVPCPEIGHGAMSGHSDMDPESHVRIFTEAMSGKPQKPCPEASGQLLPVREPVREPVKEEEGARARAMSGSGSGHGPEASDPGGGGPEPAVAAPVADPSAAEVLRRVLVAVGINPEGWVTAWWRGQAAEEHVARWIALLGPDRVVEVAAASREGNPAPPDGPKALDRAMERAAKAAVKGGGKTRTGRALASSAGSAPQTVDPVDFWGRRIADGAFVPASAVTPNQAREMLTRGLVTSEQLRARGIAA